MAGKSGREFVEPLLFLCESNADCAFVRAALNAKQKLNGCDIRPTVYSDQDTGEPAGGGNTHVGRALDRFRTFTGFNRVKHVVVVVDNDVLPDESFKSVKQQIVAISKSGAPHIAIPQQPHARATIKSGIDVTVVTIPWIGTSGALEKFLLPAARYASPDTANCLDAYVACTHVDGWASENNRDEMKLRCLLAAANEGNPGIGLGKIWTDAPHLIPIGHQSLKDVVELLAAQQP